MSYIDIKVIKESVEEKRSRLELAKSEYDEAYAKCQEAIAKETHTKQKFLNKEALNIVNKIQGFGGIYVTGMDDVNQKIPRGFPYFAITDGNYKYFLFVEDGEFQVGFHYKNHFYDNDGGGDNLYAQIKCFVNLELKPMYEKFVQR